ncbi:hypothetical protein D3C76_1644320 [compost metagenome]
MDHNGFRGDGAFVPDPLIDFFSRENPSGTLHQQGQDFEFQRSQLHRIAVQADLHQILVQLQTADAVDILLIFGR